MQKEKILTRKKPHLSFSKMMNRTAKKTGVILLLALMMNSCGIYSFTGASLRMVDKNGDLALEGEVVDYKTTPVAIQADQTSALNRLTVVVNVRFTNKLEPDKDFETRFTQFIDYPSTESLDAVKDDLIKQLVDDLTDNIFNKAVVNW